MEYETCHDKAETPSGAVFSHKELHKSSSSGGLTDIEKSRDGPQIIKSATDRKNAAQFQAVFKGIEAKPLDIRPLKSSDKNGTSALLTARRYQDMGMED
jgi:hypothetical protein